MNEELEELRQDLRDARKSGDYASVILIQDRMYGLFGVTE
jgi:hypothetical protein